MNDKNKLKNYKTVFAVLVRIAEFLTAALLILIFALYCSGRVGWFLMIVLISSPLMSVLLARVYSAYVEVGFYSEAYMLSKGGHIKAAVEVLNKTFVPAMPINITLADNPHVICDKKEYEVLVLPFSKEKFEAEYTAKIAGGSCIYIKDVKVCDYFGLASFKVKEGKWSTDRIKIGVIPDIAGLSGDEEGMKDAMRIAYSAGECEETLDEASFMFGGFPGYEYREYMPGDPLKRINSKISAKRDSLWVRLDEKTAVSTIDIVLDPCMDEKILISQQLYGSGSYEEQYAAVVQNTLETVLGMIRTLLLRDFAVEFHVCGDEGWEDFMLSDESVMAVINKRLADYIFCGWESAKFGRLPKEVSASEGALLYCTPYVDGNLRGVLDEVSARRPESVNVYVAADGKWRNV